MFEKIGLTRMASALAVYSEARIATIADNVANSDTPGFRAKDLLGFDAVLQNPTLSLRATRTGHLLGGAQNTTAKVLQPSGDMSPNGNDVSLDVEMMKSVEARQSHDMALSVYRAATAILRSSLGRNG